MKRQIIIETDIGGDPDDVFALCYFLSCDDVEIKGVTITPGDKYQVALVKAIMKEAGVWFPIGVAKQRDNREAAGFHKDFLAKFASSEKAEPDCMGHEIFAANAATSDVFICGAPTNIGNYLESNQMPLQCVYMQGCFIGYHTHGLDVPKVDKFVGKDCVPSFNPNGDKKGMDRLLAHDIKDLRFVSKNVCHLIKYDGLIHEQIMAVPPRNASASMFREGMSLYLTYHPEKKFHDPAAAVCMLHPEIATWVNNVQLYRAKGEWGADILSEPTNKKIIADIDKSKLWDYLARGE